MRSLIYIILAAALSSQALAQENPWIEFDTVQWDFGHIAENKGKVTHEFKMRNTSAEPMIILHVATSCGCTTGKHSGAALAAGSGQSLTVEFDPRGFEGDFEKKIYVTTSSGTQRYRNTLSIKGTVEPRRRTPEDAYPFYMARGVRFDASTLSFGLVGQGRVKSMVVKYLNTSDKDVKIEFEHVHDSGLLHIFAPETICAGCSGQITLTYDLEKQPSTYGTRHDTFRVAVDGTRAETPLYTAMIGIDDFQDSAPADSPKAVISPQFHDFGIIKRRARPYTAAFSITNDGTMPLTVRSVENADFFRTDLLPGTVIPPSGSTKAIMTLFSDGYMPQEIFESIVIIFDDPLRPMREIKCAAKIYE